MEVLARVVASPVACARLSCLLDETLELQPIFARQLGGQVLCMGGGFVVSILGAPYHFRVCSLVPATETAPGKLLLEGTVAAGTALDLLWRVPPPAAIPPGAKLHDWAAEAHAELFADMTAVMGTVCLPLPCTLTIGGQTSCSWEAPRPTRHFCSCRHRCS
jgi:hypothetical protein